MSKYAVLPCNGLDKAAGSLSKELALRLAEQTGSEILCPVLYRVADARYNKLASELPLLVIDGCATRCASKLAAEKGLKISEKINMTEESKKFSVDLGTNLRLSDSELRLCDMVINELIGKEQQENQENQAQQLSAIFPDKFEYEVLKKDKFIFRIPKVGFYFNENDCWAYVVGDTARIGVSDYVQQNLSDIMFFTPPAIGSEIEQFGEAGSIESGKAVFEIICPVSGTITAVNEHLLDNPEYINENPYEKGWIAELKLTDFDGDKELLLDDEGYYKILQRKVDEYHV